MANNQQAKATTEQKKDEQPNLIRVGGTRRTESYVKIAEQLLTQYEEVEISGLGNTIRTVVSAAEILKHRKYASIKKVETSMIEGDFSSRNPIAKVSVVMRRNPGVKELLEKLQEERKNETEYEKHFRIQEEKDRTHE